MDPAQEPMPTPILIIDDNPSIHEDLRKILAGPASIHPEFAEMKSRLFGRTQVQSHRRSLAIESAFQGDEGLRLAQRRREEGAPYLLAFVDVRMPPGIDGIETIHQLWRIDPHVQVVLCTAYSDYSWDEILQRVPKRDNLLILKKPFENIEVLQLVQALLEKWELTRKMESYLEALNGTVEQRTLELSLANEQLQLEIEERKQTEAALCESEERFSKAFAANPIPMALLSQSARLLVSVNSAFVDLLGFSEAELVGASAVDPRLWRPVPFPDEAVRSLVAQCQAKDGSVREVMLTLEPFTILGQDLQLMILEDITEKNRLAAQLIQAQKMESLGLLASGVAHDFNNILQIIHGYTQIIQETPGLPGTCVKPVRTILSASERASKLVKQLLVFGRKNKAQLQNSNLHATLSNLGEMIPRLLPESIAVSMNINKPLPLVQMDETLLEQALLNLVINARDAMPEGGWLQINTSEVELSTPPIAPDGARHGNRFLCITVSDTGCGMSSDILSKIFDPFFTTKEVGKGTGLGLSMVYGIVKQHGGWVEVQSQIGQGSKFRLFFPVSEFAEPVPPQPKRHPGDLDGRETILVVEDEPDLRTLLSETLTSRGYHVLEASCAPEALNIWSTHRGRIDLLLTDMVMPGGLTGRQLAEQLHHDEPDLPVIYSSGYSPGIPEGEIKTLPSGSFLPKPYSIMDMLSLLRTMLAARPKQRS